MGFIKDAIKENVSSLKSSIGSECKDCNKAVAGMESGATSMANRDTGSADQAATVVEDGKQYVAMTGPIGNLFTKALDVKFASGDQRTELATPRLGNESAAQDIAIQHKAMQLNGANPVYADTQKISNLRMGKTRRYSPPAKSALLAQRALDEIKSVDAVEWVFVVSEKGSHFHTPADVLVQALSRSPGYVPGIKQSTNKIANESDELQVTDSSEIAKLLEGLRIKGVKIVVEVEHDD